MCTVNSKTTTKRVKKKRCMSAMLKKEKMIATGCSIKTTKDRKSVA